MRAPLTTSPSALSPTMCSGAVRVGLLGLGAGAVGLRIEEGVGGAQVALAAGLVVGHHPLGVDRRRCGAK